MLLESLLHVLNTTSQLSILDSNTHFIGYKVGMYYNAAKQLLTASFKAPPYKF